VTVKGGYLIIEGRKEHVRNPNFDPNATAQDWKHSREFAEFTSGSIKTATLHIWTYGTFICRGKFSAEDGLWPAFWMTGPSRQWPANGEIDIMEYYQNKYHANLAWGSNKPGVGKWNSKATPILDIATQSGYKTVKDWSKQFHIYQMIWTPKKIDIYVDTILLNSVDLSLTVNESPDAQNPFHEPHHLILNLAIGATGGSTTHTQFPAKFIVDYVRVYQP
jgi:beta-glucanase (GH16 family)